MKISDKLDKLQYEPPLMRLVLMLFMLIITIANLGLKILALLLFSAAINAVSNRVLFMKETYTTFLQYFTKHTWIAVLVILIGLLHPTRDRDDDYQTRCCNT